MRSLPIPIQGWLMNQGLGYDSNPDPHYFSTTELLKPVQQIVLGRRLDKIPTVPEVKDIFNLALGNAVHEAIERAWLQDMTPALTALGISESVAKSISINPDNPSSSGIPVHMEQRVLKKVGKFTVGGKYDFIFDGQLYDFKTATVVSLQSQRNDQDYMMQGSIYRWLVPELIKEDSLTLCYILKDWVRGKTANPEYPQSPIQIKHVQLLPLNQTDKWVRNRLEEIERNMDLPVSLIEPCKEEELWKEPDKFKYYSKQGQQKASKVFTSEVDAYRHMQDKGTGYVLKSKGEFKRCQWCPVFSICEQKNEYFAN